MNLKDRMQSDLNSSELNKSMKKRENGSIRKQDSESLMNASNTMPRSKQLSPDVIMKKQSETIQKLSAENMDLKKKLQDRSEGNPDTQQTISDLSSQVSMLKKKTREQMQEIVALNAQIARLGDSDLQLKEAESMRDQAEKDMYKASKLASDFKKQKEKVTAALDEREKLIGEKEARVNEKKENLDEVIKGRVNYEVYVIKRKLSADYKEMTVKHKLGYGVFGMGWIFTILGVIILSKPLQNGAWEFIAGSWKVLKGVGLFPYIVGEFFAKLAFDKSSTHIGYWVMCIVIMLIIWAIMIAILIKCVIFLGDNIMECMFDGITVIVITAIMDIIIFLAPILEYIPMNMFLMGIIAFIAYMIIRFLDAWDIHEFKKQCLVMSLIVVGSALFVYGLCRLCS